MICGLYKRIFMVVPRHAGKVVVCVGYDSTKRARLSICDGKSGALISRCVRSIGVRLDSTDTGQNTTNRQCDARFPPDNAAPA